jgi:hypothetical protein
MNIYLIVLSKFWNIAFACVVVLSVASCGVKSSPVGFENQQIRGKKETPKGNNGLPPPQAFPLEYPNRPSY